MAVKNGATLSLALAARMAAVVPGGVNSNVRLEVAGSFFARGRGARLWDVNGRDYIDYVLGQGPAFLGHAHEVVTASVHAAIENGVTMAAQTEVELRAAEALIEVLQWPDMVRIGMTSTETVQAALRVSRAFTGRPLFVRFRGHYHGWLDNVLVNSSEPQPQLASLGQLSDSLEQSVTIDWNDLDALRDAIDRHRDHLAAVLMEPMMLNSGAISPEPGYLEGVREACDEANIVLIFDETITGFRLGPRGAAGRFSVTPDLAIYGKAVAGGYPASVLAGSAEVMKLLGAGVNHSGTFNANTISCAAIESAMEVVGDGSVHEAVEATGSALMAALGKLFERYELPLKIRGLPPAFHVSFDHGDAVTRFDDLGRADTGRYRELVGHAREAGVWLTNRGIWYVSAAHDRETTDLTVRRIEQALDALVSGEQVPRAGRHETSARS
jgi:glutamate-1-semialdehyde 2,1-aminomutase